MASNINVVVVDGNLTRDPELHQSQSGSSLLKFGIAVNDRRKNPASGEWEDYANYIDIVVFGNRAQSLAQILTKGMKVCISGKLRWSSWEKDGVRRSKIEVVADEVSLAQRGGQSKGQYGQQMPAAAPQSAPAAPQAAPTFSAPQQAQTVAQSVPQPAQGYPAGQGAYQQAMPQPQFGGEIVVQEEEIPFN